MRIGLNLLYLLPDRVGGTETYASGLLHGLAQINQRNEFIVFVNQESARWPLPEAPNFTRVICRVWANSRSRRYFFEQVNLPGLLKQYAIDIVHSLGYIAPLLASCDSIVTVHDLNYRAFGHWMTQIRKFALEFFVKQSVLRASRVITVSEFSRREISKAFNLPLERITTTYEAPRILAEFTNDESYISTVRHQLKIRSPYILAFSSQSPNKNIPRLLQAFAQARDRYALKHQLVIVGYCPSQNGSPSLSDAILFTGYLSNSALHAVLVGAQMLVFPSTYEGFGLPILEAMANGVPVVCSNQASLPEVGGEAAVFFDPFSVEDIAKKIAQVASNTQLQHELRQKGFENVKHFSWEKTARETMRVYEQIYQTR